MLNYRQIPAALARRESFTGNSLSAETTEWPSTGRLPREYVGILSDHAQEARARGAALYVVYSYATPIAWVATDGYAVYVPDVQYSATTSRGQSLVRRWATDDSHLIGSVA